MRKLKNKSSKLSIAELIQVKINKLKQDVGSVSFSQYLTEIANYFFIDWIWNYRLMLQKKFIKRPTIITLSGVDGSGKSTQAAVLKRSLADMGKKVKILHVGTTPFVNNNHEKRLRFRFIGYLVFAKDLLQIVFLFCKNINSDVLVFDRYIYDTIVKIAQKQQKRTINTLLLSICSKILPKPNLSFLFETDPEISYKRDASHSLEYHKTKYILYQNLPLFKLDIIRIDATGTKKKISSVLARLTSNEFYTQNTPVCNFNKVF